MYKVLHIVFISLLLAAFMVSTLHNSFLTVNFKINQDFIEQEFCINKNKPELACKGQCHFMQEMKKIEQEEQEKQGKTKNTFNEISIHLFLTQDVINTSFEHYLIVDYPQYIYRISDGYYHKITAPPKA